MVKRSNCLLTIVFLLALTVFFPPVSGQVSQPQLPHTFYGKVFVGDTSAEAGLAVEAVGPGVISNVDGNPVKTLAGGIYGETGMSSQQLIVQGDIEPGTPLEFYVGGSRAEVYPVSTNGPWRANYSYIPGELTELNLRIAAQPSISQTREPTPVQTRLPASAVQGFLPEPSVITTIRPGEEETDNLQVVQPTTVTIQPGETIGQGGQVTVTSPRENPTTVTGEQQLTGGMNATMLFAGILLVVVVLLGGIYFAMSRKKTGKQEEQEKMDEEAKEGKKDN
jgi:hypothetical protein